MTDCANRQTLLNLSSEFRVLSFEVIFFTPCRTPNSVVRTFLSVASQTI